MANLLKNKYPDLFKLVDFTKYTWTELNNLTYGSSKQVWWFCMEHYHPYQRITGSQIKTQDCPVCYLLKNALINTHPLIAREWDYTKNEDLDINTITYGSVKDVWWLCWDFKHPFLARPNNRTARNSNCPTCFHEQSKSGNKVIKTVDTGDDSEDYIFDLFKTVNFFKDVENIGGIGGYIDLVLTLKDGKQKGLQIKTLTQKKDEDTYGGSLGKKYPDDLLIVFVNKSRNRFAVMFAKDVNATGVSFYFGGKCKHEDSMFRNEKDMLKKVIELIPLSVDYGDGREHILAKGTLIEYDMCKRLEKACVKNGMIFKRNKTNGNTIDGFINDIPV